MAAKTPERILGLSNPKFPKTATFSDCIKGGVGKSLGAATAGATLEEAGRRVLLVDADGSNSTTYSTSDASFLDLRATHSRGAMLGYIRQLATEYDDVVIDVGARDEDFLVEHTPWLVRELAKVEARLVVLRPITPEPTTQASAIDYADIALPAGAAVVLCKNFGRGLKEHDFREWSKTESRARVLAAGAVECDIQDLGTGLDTARGFGVGIVDVALGRFERAGEDAALAAEQLGPDVQLWFSIWLAENCEALSIAMSRAVANTMKQSKP